MKYRVVTKQNLFNKLWKQEVDYLNSQFDNITDYGWDCFKSKFYQEFSERHETILYNLVFRRS